MTFSICVREQYETEETEQYRFGVAVTTRLPAVGTLCPFASEHGAVATQSLVNVDLGRQGIQYLEDGLAVDDALQALLNADDGAPQRQLHGVGPEGQFTFSGEDCSPWFGDTEGDGYTVAGNLLTGSSVVEETAAAYDAGRHQQPAGPMADGDAEPLASRLIDALAAGHAEGGDKRDDLRVQSAAVVVESTADHDPEPAYNDLRVDATETPIQSLRETYELAVEGHEDTLERYGDAYETDDMTAIDETA
jgi:uncharacterized Ntn-hydrolase superfamily protein